MPKFCVFATSDSKEHGFVDVFIDADNREDARRIFAGMCRLNGFEPVLSATSEEIYFTDGNGNEIVYYGFDEE